MKKRSHNVHVLHCAQSRKYEQVVIERITKTQTAVTITTTTTPPPHALIIGSQWGGLSIFLSGLGCGVSAR